MSLIQAKKNSNSNPNYVTTYTTLTSK